METSIHILCPLDGTRRSEPVLAAIMPLVRSCPSRVTLLRAVTDPHGPMTVGPYMEKTRTALERQQVRAECKLVQGDPVEQILAFAGDSKVNLIAMATGYRPGLSRLARRSVTESVLHESEVPVLVCRAGQRLRQWRRILVPLDETVSVRHLLADVSFLARHTGASVELLQAVLPAPAVPFGSDVAWMEAYGSGPDALTPLLKQLSDQLQSSGINVQPARRWLFSASGILDRIQEGQFDLVCMTTHGRSGLSRFFLGSVAEEIMRNSPCPVFIRRSRRELSAPETAAPEPLASARGEL